ncbi:MAG: N-acetyl-gamma-glutamyl-phosphate reductase [Phycisphaeraceae bacterium]|nr:MAG: N-acetyl-gamma-glutamyl-phosphate reductase [Phycisphaeraceae bacterium]
MIHTVVIGAAGYSGAELVSILRGHPGARLAGLFGSPRRAGDDAAEAPSIADLHPHLRGLVDMPVAPLDLSAIAALKPDVIFLATPHEASLDLAPRCRELGAVTIDLSGAYRLKDASLYPIHYGFEHTHENHLETAVYGMPELFRRQISAAELIAAPGCYPTASIIPLAPLLRAGAVERGRRPIIDATSGVSGAGRTPSRKTHFCEVSLQPYNVMAHRHNPEIDAYAGAPVLFTPHLGAYDRGILATIHIDLAEGWSAQRISDTLHTAYADDPFVRLLLQGAWPSVAAVRASNWIDIAFKVDEEHRHAVLFSAIDNLVKGAAGQAVQCMNLRMNLPETTGLLPGAGASNE